MIMIRIMCKSPGLGVGYEFYMTLFPTLGFATWLVIVNCVGDGQGMN